MTLLSPTPTFVTPVELDVPGPAGRSSSLLVDAQRVVWNQHGIDLDHIAAVAYSAQRRRRLLGRSSVERHISLWGADGTSLAIDLPGGTRAASFEPSHRSAYAAVTTAVHAAVEPRLRAEMLRRMAVGEVVQLGTLQMDDTGVSDTAAPGFTSAWADLPAAAIEGHRVVLTHRVECAVVHHHHVPAATPNAVLLPELFDEAAVAFS